MSYISDDFAFDDPECDCKISDIFCELKIQVSLG